MIIESDISPVAILKTAKSILLIDWPNKSVPLALIKSGFQVFCYSPDGYTVAELEEQRLTFRGIDDPPLDIDIVNVYRPGEELPGIIESHVLPLGAKVLWLHPPLISELAKELAEKYGLILIQGVNIAEVAGG